MKADANTTHNKCVVNVHHWQIMLQADRTTKNRTMIRNVSHLMRYPLVLEPGN